VTAVGTESHETNWCERYLWRHLANAVKTTTKNVNRLTHRIALLLLLLLLLMMMLTMWSSTQHVEKHGGEADVECDNEDQQLTLLTPILVEDKHNIHR